MLLLLNGHHARDVARAMSAPPVEFEQLTSEDWAIAFWHNAWWEGFLMRQWEIADLSVMERGVRAIRTPSELYCDTRP